MNIKTILFFCLFLLTLNQLRADGFLPADAIDSAKQKVILEINASGGILCNKTLGVRPLINIILGFKLKKDFVYGSYERRYGSSANPYPVLDNDSLKMTDVYSGNYFGIEYSHLFINKFHDELYSIVGMGYDGIDISKNSIIANDIKLRPFSFNIGFGYSYYFNSKHGPHIEVLYHYADFNRDQKANIDASSLIVRLTYGAGRVYKSE